jgi:SAM-dependent methyltransferase
MLERLISVFTSTNRNNRLFQTVILLAIVFIALSFYKKTYGPTGKEGFSQSDKYILKENGEIYDEFYSEIYDKLMLPQDKSQYIISKMIVMTEPSKQYSSFLDIGSGTGDLVASLRNSGYKAYGIDKSRAMVERSKIKYPDTPIKCGDSLIPITYDRGSFTHILCTGMTIYEIENQRQLFQNIYFWLQPNGYLILQLVVRDTFDTVIPGGNPGILDGQVSKYAERRITDTLIDYVDFTYKSSYKFKDNGTQVVHKEIFTDSTTKSIRENERTINIEEPNDILKIAVQYGFILKGKSSMDSPGEYLYILERLN